MAHVSFQDRVVVITGAGGNPGLGRSYAMLMAGRGARVVVNDLGILPGREVIDASAAEQVATEIRHAGGEAASDTNSVADEAGCRAVIQTAIDTFGRVDAVINNAGIAPAIAFPDLSSELVRKVVDTHLMGHIWMCRAAWPHMRAQGYGRVVNVSSGLALRGSVDHPVYTATKLGIVGLTLSLAQEGTAHGIKVNAVMPGAETLGRPDAGGAAMSPDRVAPVAALLAAESCSITGRTLLAQAGSVKELRFRLTQGVDQEGDLTVDSLLEAMSQVTDASAGDLVGVPVD